MPRSPLDRMTVPVPPRPAGEFVQQFQAEGEGSLVDFPIVDRRGLNADRPGIAVDDHDHLIPGDP